MAYNPNLPAGATAASASAPVAIATDQINDVLVTGQATAALGNNILLSTAGTASFDTMAYTPTLRSFSTQVIGSSGISAGQIIFEESNDGTTWIPTPISDDTVATGSIPIYYASGVAASSNKFYSGRLMRRYFRCRISTGFTGGTVQAITKFSAYDMASRTVNVVQAQTGYVNVTAKSEPGIYNYGYSATTTASTNAALILTGSRLLTSVAFSNPTATAAYVKIYNKATAPTVGTDVPILNYTVPAGGNVSFGFPFGIRLSAGLGIAVTGDLADADTTNAPAGVHVNVGYA